MAHEAGEFDATLAAAAGEDGALLRELRAAFIDSLTQQVDLLRRARCDGNWQVAAMRLRGLGASFHAPELVRLADQALEGAPGEPGVLRRLDRLCAEFVH
jgi:HPt (histidine-containing phosphotransfer) domain-containing protein